MSKENKATAAEAEGRLNKVFDLIIAGASRQQILQYVAKKTDWNLCARQVDNYISSATERIVAAGKIKREQEIAKALLRFEQIYFLSISLQNFQSALAAQREINKLLGLNMEENLIKRVEMLEMGLELSKK